MYAQALFSFSSHSRIMNLCAENVEKEKKNGGSGSITAIL
jgi:hypothetical protein